MRLPERAAIPGLLSLAAGTELHRVHHVDYPGARFNPCLGAPSRFAPLHAPGGGCIPTLYAAATLDAAAYETVFRGIPSPYATLPRQALADRGASVIAPHKALDLVPLFAPELTGLGLDPAQVFAPAESAYAACRALAALAWRDNPGAHGLVWSSVRDDSARAMLFFGDRLAEGDFTCAGTREVRRDESLLEDLRRAGRRAGWTIAR